VLDDRDRRLGEVLGRPSGRVGVDVVVVGHLLAVQLLRRGQTGAAQSRVSPVERGGLVRVLAVAQDRGLVPRRPRPRREAGAVRGVGQHVAHPARDGDVVGRGVLERLGRQPLPLGQREAAHRDRGQHVGVARGAGDDGDRRVVLGRGPHHRRAADVDLLDALVGAGAGGHRLAEGIEVRDHQVERLDTELLELPDVGVEAAVGQDAGVHLGVQRLDPAIEALGEACQLLDLGHRDAEPLDQCRRPAGRHERDARLVQAADELLEPGLVVDGHQRAPDGDPVGCGVGCGVGHGVGHGVLLTSSDEGTQAFDGLDFTPWWSSHLRQSCALSIGLVSRPGRRGARRSGTPRAPSVPRTSRASRVPLP